MSERLVNKNQLEEDKELFSKYGFYLLDSEDNKEEAFRRYVYCDDMLNARKLCEESKELPVAIRMHSIDVQYSRTIELDFTAGTIKAEGCYELELFELLIEIMREHDRK